VSAIYKCIASQRNKELVLCLNFFTIFTLSACASSDDQPGTSSRTKTFNAEKLGDDCAAVSENSTKPATIDDAYQRDVEGDFEGALEAIKPILLKNPHDRAALKIRAECNYAKKQYASAIADLSEVIKADPERGSYFLRAQVYQSDNQHLLAEKDFAKVVALDLRKVVNKSDQAPPLKTRIIHMIFLGSSMEKQGKDKQAIELYTHILSLDKDEQSTLRGRVRALLKLGKTQDALLDLDHAINLNSSDATLKLERAECLLLLGKNTAASSDFKQVQAFKPELKEWIHQIRTKYRLL